MKINKILVVFLALFIPFIILMGGVRLIMRPAFAEFEYDRAGFPRDPYGMDTSERKQWAGYSIRYLTNSEPIDYLGNLQNFKGQKIFTESELSHMEDVKDVVQGWLLAWYVVVGLSVAILGWFLIMGQWSSMRQAFQAGGWVTIGLISAIFIFMLVNFNTLFTLFHRFLNFSEGTWLFDESSMLIRLLPLELWQDAFAIVLTFTLLVGLLLVAITRKRKITTVA